MEEHATEAQQETKPSRLPVYLSALFLPGAGQFVQRRWVSGLLFATTFLLCFVAFMVYVVKIILAFYSVGLDFNTYQTSEVTNIPTVQAVVAFLAAMGIYTANIIDALMAYQRQCRSWSARKWGVSQFLEQHAPQ